jgi:hypothetical protein
MDWAEPLDFRDWARRVCSFRSLFIGLLFLILLVSELRFDWVEQAVGSFLVTTNAKRSESGRIWEIGNQTQNARKTLEQIVTDNQSMQREARNATSFKRIAATIQPDQWIMISPDHFRRLYLKLSPETAEEIIPAFEMLTLLNDSQWDRTYFEKDGAGLRIYLLDKNNRVLRQLDVSDALLYYMEQSEIEIADSPNYLKNFENRIYPADVFFHGLQSLNAEVRKGALPRPENLLRIPGRITRVGISDEAISGFIELAFEIESGTRRTVIVMRGHEWAVWRLRSALENLEIKESVPEQPLPPDGSPKKTVRFPG